MQQIINYRLLIIDQFQFESFKNDKPLDATIATSRGQISTSVHTEQWRTSTRSALSIPFEWETGLRCLQTQTHALEANHREVQTAGNERGKKKATTAAL